MAGQEGAVTVATNMAGRGTDIKLSEKARAAGGLYVIGTERHESVGLIISCVGVAVVKGTSVKANFISPSKTICWFVRV